MRILYRMKMFVVFAMVVLFAGAMVPRAMAQSPEEEAAIQEALSHVLLADSLFEEDNKAVMAAWLAYAFDRIGWLNQNMPDTMTASAYRRSYEEEVHARESLAKVWDELKEKDPALEDLYLDELVVVNKAGYMREYVWLYLGDETWQGPPQEERLIEFITWQDTNIPGHQAETLAGLSF